MKQLIEKAKTLFFLDTEKEEVSFAVAMHLESVIRYIEEMQQASKDGQYYDYVKVPKREWQRLLNTINFEEPKAAASLDETVRRSAPLESIKARYKDLVQRLGVQGHEGAISEISLLRKTAGLDA